jgi:hypothetical protein
MRVLVTLQHHLGFDKIPHHTTIRQWVLKRGYYQIVHHPFEKARDWVGIFDLTISVGSIKCLLILGVRFTPLRERDNGLTLTHADVQVVGLHCSKKSSGDFIYRALKTAEEKIGHPFASLLRDEGSDVDKGTELYQKDSKKTVGVHDISHKLANVLEKALKNDEHWQQFCKQLTATKQAVQQTCDLAALMPPKLRSQARYMSADVLMDWLSRFQQSKKEGRMNSISKERFDEYFGWLSHLEPYIEDWKQMVAIVEIIKDVIHYRGYSQKAYHQLEKLLSDQYPNASTAVIDFIDATLNTVWDEVEQLKPRQTVLGDSRIIESIFGKFKQSPSSQLQGITIGALGIATFMANNEASVVKQAMETTSIGQVWEWGKKYIGESLASARRKFFPHRKGNKNEGNYKGVAYT